MAQRSTTTFISHTGRVLSRSVTFQFALDPNVQQRNLLAKCAGARWFAMNHHLARVKANLDARAAERESLGEGEKSSELSTPSLSWAAFSFINEFNGWKNGRSDDSPINEDGRRGLAWRHELPNDVFECASVDAARASRTSLPRDAANAVEGPSGSPVSKHRGR